MENTFKIGDILDYEWGYDQTNVEFFQVVGITASGKSVKIRKIKQTCIGANDMTGTCIALKDQFIENAPVLIKRVKSYKDQPIVVMDYSTADKWNGLPVSYSSYA